MSPVNSRINLPYDSAENLVQSRLLDGASEFAHNSWLGYSQSFRGLSRLARKMLVSQLIEVPYLKSASELEEQPSDFFERFVCSPSRFLLLAGIAANSKSAIIGRSTDPNLKRDEAFGTKLGVTLSLDERFDFAKYGSFNMVQIGLLLFHKNATRYNDGVWNLCKLSLEKKVVQSVNYRDIDPTGVHSMAIKTLWAQVDAYLTNHNY